MRTPASIARHPLHPILITIPIGLWVFSFACDLVVFFRHGDGVEVLWFMLAYCTLAAGLAGALVAAIPGLIDFQSLADRRVRKLATRHMTINLVVIVLYTVNLWLRSIDPPVFLAGMGLSVVGIALLAISGWIGGEMVHVHGVGVAIGETADAVGRAEGAHAEPSVTRLGRI